MFVYFHLTLGMLFNKNVIFILVFLSCVAGNIFSLSAQNIPIGSWRSHFAHNNAYSITMQNNTIFVAAAHLWSYNLAENEFTSYTKVNGMSDIGIKLIRYDAATDYLIIIYNNSNIDLMYHNTFYNIPDIKNLNITGSNSINSVYFKNNKMYLATDFGIVVLNPEKKEIADTYVLQQDAKVLNIKSMTSKDGYFYVATSEGIYTADENNPTLQNFANWQKIAASKCNFIFKHSQELYCTTNDSLLKFQNGQLQFLYKSPVPILNVYSGANDFYLCESNDIIRFIKMFNSNGILYDSTSSINPRDMIEVNQNEIWEADYWEGLVKLKNRKEKNLYRPEGKWTNNCYNLSIYNNDVYASAGAQKAWIYTYNGDGFSKFSNGNWTNYNRFVNTPGLDSVLDILDIAVDNKTGTTYAASYFSGLYELRKDGTYTIYRNTPYIQAAIGDQTYRIVDLEFDKDNNLWMSNYAAPEQLVVKKSDGTWQKFAFPYTVSEKTAGEIVIDNANQKWMQAPRGVGIYVLNDNNTIDNKNDDKIKLLRSGSGLGNLPSSDVNCITKDLNGKIWVGTVDGIAIYNCPESIFSTNGCEAELKIVKYDLNAGLLFQKENVRTIAVDGANNKWIGTNNGVWLISDDAEKILQRFTATNSPLPSNEINKIIVHPTTGEVFIACNGGLVSYRAAATEINKDNEELHIFPNPVPTGYTGTVAISGIVGNADVRITDVTGQLVYRTKSQGGQATWNTYNYLGKKPKTGVYYVFVTNSDGSESKTGKFIFYE